MLDRLSKNNFQELISSKTIVTVLDGPDLTLTLDQLIEHAKPKGNLPEGCRMEPFSLILKGPSSHQVPDGTYDITFEKLGLIEGIYLDNKYGEADAPVAGDEDAEDVFYQIIFS